MSIERGISEKSASGIFLKQAFFCYTELLKSIPPPLSGPPGVWGIAALRVVGHSGPSGVWALRPFRMLCEYMRTEQEKENGISEYFV